MDTYTYYHASEPRGMRLICNSREALRRVIQERESWSSGRYNVFESPAVLLRSESSGLRWGAAVKHPDGSVELIPDSPA